MSTTQPKHSDKFNPETDCPECEVRNYRVLPGRSSCSICLRLRMAFLFGTKITIWEKWAEDKERGTSDWYFNHISNGYDSSAASPTPYTNPATGKPYDNQKGWIKSKWRSRKGFLLDGVVVD